MASLHASLWGSGPGGTLLGVFWEGFLFAAFVPCCEWMEQVATWQETKPSLK